MNAAPFAFAAGYRARVLALPGRIRTLAGGAEGLRGRDRGGRLEFREHRGYVPGDDLRDLDWNLLLRLGVLATKEYTRGESPEAMLILDRSASMGEFDAGKDRIAREYAGGLASVALHAHAPFTLAILGEGGPVALGQWTSPRKLDACLRIIESLGAPSGPTHLQGLANLKPPPGNGRAAFLVSDLFADPLPVAALAALRGGGGGGTIVHAISELDRHPALPPAGTVLDPETGAVFAYSEREPLLRRFREEFGRHQEQVAEIAARHGLARQVLSDWNPFEQAVYESFRPGSGHGVS